MHGVAPVTVFPVDDDPAGQKLIRTSLNNHRTVSDVYGVDSAEEALGFLHQRCAYENRNTSPDLIPLSLNTPVMGGKESLKHIKEDDDPKRITMAVLSTSDSERDILASYRPQAAGYVHKPVTLDEFMQVMAEIEDY